MVSKVKTYSIPIRYRPQIASRKPTFEQHPPKIKPVTAPKLSNAGRLQWAIIATPFFKLFGSVLLANWPLSSLPTDGDGLGCLDCSVLDNATLRRLGAMFPFAVDIGN